MPPPAAAVLPLKVEFLLNTVDLIFLMPPPNALVVMNSGIDNRQRGAVVIADTAAAAVFEERIVVTNLGVNQTQAAEIRIS